MKKKNELPEEQGIEDKKEQGVPVPESRNADKTVKPQISKLILIIGGIVTALVIVGLIVAIAIGGSKNNGETSHSHIFDDWSATKNPTCTEDGTKVRYCNCGEKQSDVIPANGHKEQVIPAKEATCTETGLTEGKKCYDCGKILLAQQETPVVSHTYDDKYDESCNKCDFIREAECAHTITEVIKGYDATCTTKGLTDGTKCKKCGVILEQQITIGHLGHAEVIDAAIPASCTTDGKTEGKHCSRCNQTLVAQTTIGKYGHYEIIDPAIPATCTTDGKSSGKHCGRCNYTLVAQTTIPAFGHSYNDGVIISEATCLSQGIKQYTCTVTTCRHSYTENYSLPTYTATEIANRAIEYVGEITTYDKNGYAVATGTGFVMSSDGKIITNYHVIEDAYSAQIIINDTFYTIASVLAYDANIDLAVLKVNSTGLTAATVCKNPVNVGETVYAIGSSRGLTNTFSQGIVTYADRVVDGVSHIQHDASITHGNSGGPLINVYGEVVGINTWGISDSQNLNFAVATSELDNLVYITPISLSELYNLNNNPYDILVDWVLDNYNATYENEFRFNYYSDSAWYSLVLQTSVIDGLYIDVLWEFDDGAELYLFIDFYGDLSSYYYYASYTDDGYKNYINGHINATTFTPNTALDYTSYEGTHWNQSAMLSLYQSAVVDLIGWFNWATDYYNMGVTIKDMGFDIFDVTTNEVSAFDTLMNHIVYVGDYDSSTQWYKIRKTYYYSNYNCAFNLVYDSKDNSAFISMVFYPNDTDEAFYCYLSLKPGSNGAYFGCTYSVYQNGSYVDMNNTWGYINPSTFTDNTILSYNEYDGLTQEKAYLLNVYSGCLCDILDWLDEYLYDNNLGITIADLGYTSY